MEYIQRNSYLQKLIDRKDNGLIKIITGIRRCGKSYLLFTLYKDYLLSIGIKKENIIPIDLDDENNSKYTTAFFYAKMRVVHTNPPWKFCFCCGKLIILEIRMNCFFYRCCT